MEIEKKKIVSIGNSKGMIIPVSWIKGIKEITGKDIEEIEVETGDTYIKVKAIIDDVPYTANTWRAEMKRILLESEEPECSLCHSRKNAHNLILHHKQPLSMGGKDCRDNLMLVCSKCHRLLHSAISGSEAAVKVLEIIKTGKALPEEAIPVREHNGIDITEDILNESIRQKKLYGYQ
jgi:antitoxin component of MazEF toxin-antitoxin module